MEDTRIRNFFVILILALLVGGLIKGMVIERQPIVIEDTQGRLEGETGGEQAIEEEQIAVHVNGAVNQPGVYYFKHGDRVLDAVERALPKPEADVNKLQMARRLTDGETINVPRIGDEFLGTARGNMETTVQTGRISINQADQLQLESLPGIGPAYAQRIMEYRSANGGFTSIDDLKKVSGIGERTFEGLKDLIVL